MKSLEDPSAVPLDRIGPIAIGLSRARSFGCGTIAVRSPLFLRLELRKKAERSEIPWSEIHEAANDRHRAAASMVIGLISSSGNRERERESSFSIERDLAGRRGALFPERRFVWRQVCRCHSDSGESKTDAL